MNAGQVVILGVIAFGTLPGCGDRAADVPASNAPAATTVAAPPTLATPSLSVQVSLSPEARTKLAKDAETIIVSASFFGDPTAIARDRTNDVGQIDLGRIDQELRGPGAASFELPVDAGKLQLLSGQPQVNINVYSGRRSSPDNLLDCDMFQDALAVAVRQPVKLHCKLLAEP